MRVYFELSIKLIIGDLVDWQIRYFLLMMKSFLLLVSYAWTSVEN